VNGTEFVAACTVCETVDDCTGSTVTDPVAAEESVDRADGEVDGVARDDSDVERVGIAVAEDDEEAHADDEAAAETESSVVPDAENDSIDDWLDSIEICADGDESAEPDVDVVGLCDDEMEREESRETLSAEDVVGLIESDDDNDDETDLVEESVFEVHTVADRVPRVGVAEAVAKVESDADSQRETRSEDVPTSENCADGVAAMVPDRRGLDVSDIEDDKVAASAVALSIEIDAMFDKLGDAEIEPLLDSDRDVEPDAESEAEPEPDRLALAESVRDADADGHRVSRADVVGIDETEIDTLMLGLPDVAGDFVLDADTSADLLGTSETSDVADCRNDPDSTFDRDADRVTENELLPETLDEADMLSVGSGEALPEAAELLVGKLGDSLDEGLGPRLVRAEADTATEAEGALFVIDASSVDVTDADDTAEEERVASADTEAYEKEGLIELERDGDDEVSTLADGVLAGEGDVVDTRVSAGESVNFADGLALRLNEIGAVVVAEALGCRVKDIGGVADCAPEYVGCSEPVTRAEGV
jgi:hypothetical protein